MLIVQRAPAYSNITLKCLLCLHEKLEIVNYPYPDELPNKPSELVCKRRRVNKYLLNNYKALSSSHPSGLHEVLSKYNFDVKRILIKM